MPGSWTGTKGVIIAGRYRLRAPIAKGAMGEVWRAEHLTLRSPVAVKLIDPELVQQLAGSLEEREIIARFQREARAGALLRHPNVAHIYDHGLDNGVPFIVMELLEGETLAERLKRGPLSHADTARIISQAARALRRAHECGIIHRDLKPDNIFLVRGDEEGVKVLDFGVAKFEKGSAATIAQTSGRDLTSTQTGNIVGTPCYMSPEQVEGRELDWRTDLWSLAVIAYECVCGSRPFDSVGLGALALKICVDPLPMPSQHAQVPFGFDAWWQRAAARDPAARFQSARDLAEALRAVLAPTMFIDATNPAVYLSSIRIGGSDTGASSSLEVPVPERSNRAAPKLVLAAIVMVATLALVGFRIRGRLPLLNGIARGSDAHAGSTTPANEATAAPVPTAPSPSAAPTGDSGATPTAASGAASASPSRATGASVPEPSRARATPEPTARGRHAP